MLSGETEVLLRSDSGLPLLLRTECGTGAFFYFAAALWNELFPHGRHVCADAFWERLGGFAPMKSSVPTAFASGAEYDYVLVANPEGATECVIETERSAELIFGRGTLVRQNGKIKLADARHAILRMEKIK